MRGKRKGFVLDIQCQTKGINRTFRRMCLIGSWAKWIKLLARELRLGCRWGTFLLR
jgi:hypothetical protein